MVTLHIIAVDSNYLVSEERQRLLALYPAEQHRKEHYTESHKSDLTEVIKVKHYSKQIYFLQSKNE